MSFKLKDCKAYHEIQHLIWNKKLSLEKRRRQQRLAG